jgi:hypothetical protein
MAGHRLHLPQVGAAARFAVEGLGAVLGLEDERLHEAGYPVALDGTVKLYAAQLEGPGQRPRARFAPAQHVGTPLEKPPRSMYGR